MDALPRQDCTIDFIGIGVQKAGTSSIWNFLQASQIGGPVKEVHFFCTHRNISSNEFQGYCKRVCASNNQISGEITPEYIFHPQAMANIARFLPHVRIFASFRNPIDRAYSAFLHMRGRGLIPPKESFLSAVREDLKSVGPWSLVLRGFYDFQLRRVYDLFPRDQVKVLIFEEITSPDYGVHLSDLLNFLGSNPIGLPVSWKKSNARERWGSPEQCPSYPEAAALLGDVYGESIERFRKLVNRRALWTTEV